MADRDRRVRFLGLVCVALVATLLIVEFLHWNAAFHRDLYRVLMAGTHKAEIDAAFGPPRATAAAGTTLRNSGWNGPHADEVCSGPTAAYVHSVFYGVVCTFDVSGTLTRARIDGL